MIRKIMSTAFVAVSLLSATSAVAGPPVCAVLDPIWRAGHTTSQTTLITAVDTMATSVATQSSLTIEQVISAIRIATRQRSLNATREAEFQAASAEAIAQVYANQSVAEQIRAAHQTYGPQGQAVGGCDAIAELQVVDAALSSVTDRASEVLGSGAIDTVAGSGTSPEEAIRRRLAFDTPEAVSAVAFLAPDTSAADRDAFMNNVIGLPRDLPDDLAQVGNRITVMESRRFEAIRSPAIVSLSAVRAASEASGHFETDGGDELSTFGAVDYIVGRFGGGDEYEEWSAGLVTKSPEGILKEISRIRAMQLVLQNSRQGVADRRQTVLAALLAAEVVQ